ncbi:MAG: hypothetical protein ABJB11_12195 [Ferruginibacter sp.]
MDQLIATLHSDHSEWTSKLDFYKDDIGVFQKRLQEVAGKNNAKDFSAELEHFQNQLILEQEQIDLLKHAINKHENVIEKSVISNPVASDHRRLPGHDDQHEDIKRFEELFASLRKELLAFLAVWM